MPNDSPSPPARELSLRGLALGVLLTVVFTAANVYFGLKAALTFASSIPAAVISMAVLRVFRGSSVLENNIVQTVASAAGALSAIVFVVPGLVMIGWWRHIPYLETFLLCALGGVLGVTFSIPLRRALVAGSDLPFPEGVACAEVLRVGSPGEAGPDRAVDPVAGRAGLLAVIRAALVSAGLLLAQGTGLLAASLPKYVRIGRAATGAELGLSLALYGVGHLVGLEAGLAMLLGLAIAWGGCVPVLTAAAGDPSAPAAAALAVWSHKVRFIGAGLIGVAAIASFFKLAGPVFGGMAETLGRRAPTARAAPGQDLSPPAVFAVSLVALAGIVVSLHGFARAAGFAGAALPLALGGGVFVLIVGLFVSAICGYMAGLVGSSNSPVSGVGILAVLAAAALIAGPVRAVAGPAAGTGAVAFALMATAFVFAAAIVGNDNLQDLKTGQLVGASPRAQQVALLVGVIAGAAVIPPVLELLNRAYGFAGAPGADPARALAAPQATLISSIARGVIQGGLDWRLIGFGAGLGVIVVGLDAALARAGRMRLAPLAVGLGVYLPMSTTLTVVIGAVGGRVFTAWARGKPDPEALERLAVLTASGLIVGEGLAGVGMAGLIGATGKSAPLALVGDAFAGPAAALGAAAAALAAVLLFARLPRLLDART